MKIFLLFLSFSCCFAAEITLDNQSSHPSSQTKMGVQWAYSAKEVNASNHDLQYGEPLKNVQMIQKTGSVTLKVPSHATYFRVVVWSQKQKNPDYHTNWVEVVPQKTYILKNEHLVPARLVSGTGC